MQLKEFSVEENFGGRIVIYGAGIFGEYAIAALKYKGVQPVCFVDRRKAGQTKCGFPVKNPDTLFTEYKDCLILVAVGVELRSAYDWLLGKGCGERICSVKNLIFNTDFSLSDMSVQAQDKPYYKILYQWGLDSLVDDERLRLPNIDWVITERCSLKCENCANLMPYYEKPCDYDFGSCCKELDNLLAVADEILDLRILGGEPFMNRDFTKYIEYARSKEKIRNVTIYTNATILPNEQTLQAIKNPKVRLEITDYGTLAPNFKKFVDVIDANKIRHNIVKQDYWQDLGELSDRNSDLAQRERTYAMCYCRTLPTLQKGYLYRCPWSSNGRILNAIPYCADDVLDFTKPADDTSFIKNKLRDFIFNSKSDLACGYCSGRNEQLATVPPARQTKKHLPYKKLPAFSVIITNYNYGQFLPESIESVLCQTMQDFELIVSDDGSTDNSRQIIDEYCAKHPDKVRKVYKENGGQYSAFYEAYKISKGKYISILDSDDKYYPEMLERKLEAHEKHPDCGLVETALTADGKRIYSDKNPNLDYHELFTKYGYNYPAGTSSGISARRDVLEKVLPLKINLYRGGYRRQQNL